MSMGAGVNSVAMLLKFRDEIDAVIFADTGDEKPGTYEYIETYLKPYCRQHGIAWHTVRNPNGLSISDYSLERHVMPIMARRWCTNDFKLRPILKKLRELGATRRKPIDVMVGIAADESHRVDRNAYIDKPKYQHKVYPLLDHGIDRKKCYEIIAAHGWGPPVKSGCDMCPFTGRREIIKIHASDPARYRKIVEMERRAMRNPRIRLRHRPLTGTKPLPMIHELRSLDHYQDGGDDDEPQMPCGAYCMEDGK